MRQAIETKFYGATNNKPGRIRVRCDARTIWVNWDYGLDTVKNHRIAAQKLTKELGWKWFEKSFATGVIGNVYYHVKLTLSMK